MKDFEKIFEDFTNIKVAVVGDVMLDTYWWGHVDRISPEAPVPVVALNKKELRIGGAGNVALNVVALGAQTSIISVVGNDEDAASLIQLFQENKIKTDFLLKSDSRITTNKTRIISRNQQMMRLDAEITNDITEQEAVQLSNQFKKYLEEEKPQIVIFEDYNKGVLTENIIRDFIQLCKQHNVLTTVDPKKKNFFAYKGVDIFKPNLKEVKEGLNIFLDNINIDALSDVHTVLNRKIEHEISLITLSEHGVFYHSKSDRKIIPTHVRNIADVSGAGDTVIAVASLAYASTKDIQLAAEMANIAGGLVCEEVGTAAIDKEKLLKECIKLL